VEKFQMLGSRRLSTSCRLLGAILVLVGGGPVAVAAQAAPSPASASGMVSAPVWIKTPNQGDMARVYPLAARQLGLAGGATLTCRIDAKGMLHTCTVANEAPAKAGFGQAALALAPAYRMADMDQMGLATQGNQVAIPIRFVAPTPTGSRLKSVGF
jgi:TonB family protein